METADLYLIVYIQLVFFSLVKKYNNYLKL